MQGGLYKIHESRSTGNSWELFELGDYCGQEESLGGIKKAMSMVLLIDFRQKMEEVEELEFRAGAIE